MSNKTIKPIQTHYKGYHFRSRLEARWAVFFEVMQVKWSYEPEGFVLPDGTKYLPDFFIHSERDYHRPGSGWWIEIKPTYPSESELDKFKQLCESTEHNGYLFIGLPAEQPWIFIHRSGSVSLHGRDDEVFPTPDNIWRECRLKTELCFLQTPRWDEIAGNPCATARSARFEHGQKGAAA